MLRSPLRGRAMFVCALVTLVTAACSRRAAPRADPAAVVAVDAAAANEPVLRPLEEPSLPEEACHRALCVAPSDTPVVPPYRAPFSRCAPVISVAEADRRPGDAPEGFFSPSATRLGRRLADDACCYVVQQACDAGTAAPDAHEAHGARRR